MVTSRGRYALRETGNCAVDSVFDPELRRKISKNRREAHRWTPSVCLQTYQDLSRISPEYGVVSCYCVKSNRFFELSEYLLHGLIIVYVIDEDTAHAVRIIALEKSGICVVEGNWHGNLGIGRFVSFQELVWPNSPKPDGIIVISRSPHMRYIWEEVTPSDFADPETYAAVNQLVEDANRSELLKVISREMFFKLPQAVRRSLLVFRLGTGQAYNVRGYGDFIDLIEDLLLLAQYNPSRKIVTYTWSLPRGVSIPKSCQLPKEIAEKMYIYFDKPGGDQHSLSDCLLMAKSIEKQNKTQELCFQLCCFTETEFKTLSEDTKKTMVILTPQLDDNGNQIDAGGSWWECQQVSCGEEDSNDDVTISEDGVLKTMPLAVLMDNPLKALLILDRVFDIEYFVGHSCRLSRQEQKMIDSIPLRTSPEQMVEMSIPSRKKRYSSS